MDFNDAHSTQKVVTTNIHANDMLLITLPSPPLSVLTLLIVPLIVKQQLRRQIESMIANAKSMIKIESPTATPSRQQQQHDVTSDGNNVFAKSNATPSFRQAHGTPTNAAQNGPPVTSIFSKIMQLSKQDRNLLAIRLSNAQL